MTVVVSEALLPRSGRETGDEPSRLWRTQRLPHRNLRVTARDWTKYAPVMIGAKLDVIYSYSEKDVESWCVLKAEKQDASGHPHVEFRHTDLTQKSTRYYRASTVNEGPREKMSDCVQRGYRYLQ